jgi:hypothetical protein
LQRHRQVARLTRRTIRSPVPDLARLSDDGQPDVERLASTTNRSDFLKSRLYAKSLMGPILERYQPFNQHFAHAYAETPE